MKHTLRELRHWSWLKKTLFLIAAFTFLTSSFLFLTAPGGQIREFLAGTVITTQHRSWAWIFVGAEQRDLMVKRMQNAIEEAAIEKQNMSLIQIKNDHRQARTVDELIKVEDISGQFWKGKKMYVYDPTSIRVMTPSHAGEGERISSMVTRTGAVAGVNGGGFDDPEGLGNGFAAIGAIISGGEVIFTDQDGSIAQHIVGFTKEGTLVVGKYNIFELREMGLSEGVSFYPRLVANGKPLITSGDGGWGRGPRTAVGQKADGTVIFIVIDGRQSHSVGATLKEVQDLFLEEGVINAGNLDGGASSELVVEGNLVTKPSSRYGERRLPSAFLVYDQPELAKPLHVWDGIDKIDAGGSYDHPDFLREQAELKSRQQQQKTQPTTPTKTDTGKTTTGSDKSKTEDTKTDNGAKDTKTEPKTETKPGTKTDTPAKTDTKTDPAKAGDAGKTPTGTNAGTGDKSDAGAGKETNAGTGTTGGAAQTPGAPAAPGTSGGNTTPGAATPPTAPATSTKPASGGTGGTPSTTPPAAATSSGSGGTETPGKTSTGQQTPPAQTSTPAASGQTKTTP